MFIAMLMAVALFQSPAQSQTSECSSRISAASCDFYTCEENQKWHCGSDGYPLDFGYRFCQKFLDLDTSTFSDAGKAWLSSARVALQKAFLQLEETSSSSRLTCSELENEAFASHVPVYRDTGFCNLSPLDRYQIYFHLRRALIDSGALTVENSWNIAATCLEDRGLSYIFSSSQNPEQDLEQFLKLINNLSNLNSLLDLVKP